MALAGFSSRAVFADELVYQNTLNTCLHDTDFEMTSLEKVIYYVSYFSVDVLGPNKHVYPYAHIQNTGIFIRNFKSAALSVDFSRDSELKKLVESPDFHRALNDCLPDSRYPNAAALKAAFVMELLSQQAVGKIAGGMTLLATGEGAGLAVGALRRVSVRAYYWAMGAILGSAFIVPAISKIIVERDREQLFPHYLDAKNKSLSEGDQSRAVTEDFLQIAKESNSNLDAVNDQTDGLIDGVLKDLSQRLAAETDPVKKQSLEQKISILKDAR